jgi:hypothetical protein
MIKEEKQYYEFISCHKLLTRKLTDVMHCVESLHGFYSTLFIFLYRELLF